MRAWYKRVSNGPRKQYQQVIRDFYRNTFGLEHTHDAGLNRLYFGFDSATNNIRPHGLNHTERPEYSMNNELALQAIQNGMPFKLATGETESEMESGDDATDHEEEAVFRVPRPNSSHSESDSDRTIPYNDGSSFDVEAANALVNARRASEQRQREDLRGDTDDERLLLDIVNHRPADSGAEDEIQLAQPVPTQLPWRVGDDGEHEEPNGPSVDNQQSDNIPLSQEYGETQELVSDTQEQHTEPERKEEDSIPETQKVPDFIVLVPKEPGMEWKRLGRVSRGDMWNGVVLASLPS